MIIEEDDEIEYGEDEDQEGEDRDEDYYVENPTQITAIATVSNLKIRIKINYVVLV